MSRNAPAPVRDRLLARHQPASVRVLLNSTTEYVEAGECLSFMLQNGEILTTDAAIYDIGTVANDMLAHEVGLEAASGITTDTVCTASDPAISAVGGVATTRQADDSSARVEN